jgi:hypothetical protein
MKTKHILPLVAILVGISLLAYPLRSLGQSGVILPLARLAWLIKGYYGAFPQATYWVVALIAAFLIAAASLPLVILNRPPAKPDQHRLNGPVQEIGFWLRRMKKGLYPRWHLARLLAELSINILDLHGRSRTSERTLVGPDWNPPQAVQDFLQTALSSSHADYSRPKWIAAGLSTPFDQDLESVLEYLESYLEMEHERDDS